MSYFFKYFVLLFVAYHQAQIVIEGCHNPQHVRPTSALDIAGRRKRNILGENATFAKDADPVLSEFFTECLLGKTGPIFGSWRSVVDFVLRDTYWFEATDAEYCSGRKDTVKCWQRRAGFLLKAGSILLTPTKDCIYDFDRSVKEERGLDFELYYRDFFESYDYEVSLGEFGQSRKGRLEDVSGDHESTDPTASTNYTPESSTVVDQTCSVFAVAKYQICLGKEVEKLVESADIINQFPSLLNFDVISNSQFVVNHYSSCRIKKEQKNDTISYIENCHTVAAAEDDLLPKIPPSNNLFSKIPPATSSPRIQLVDEIVSMILPIDVCLIIDLPEIVKSNSPIFLPTVQCVPDEKTTPTVKYERPTEKGRIGECRGGDRWTRWFNVDSPEGEGDMETLQILRETYRGQICKNPTAVDARTVPFNTYHSGTDDLVYLSLQDGLRCFNSEQGQRNCSDYRIRFCCRMEVPQCDGTSQWTPWLNDDDRKNGGDFEYLSKHIEKNGVCSNPIAIQARTARKKKHYMKSLNIIDISPEKGLVCNQTEQHRRRCKDFEVSFCCPE